MNDVQFISDPHIGHTKAAEWRGYKSVEEMNKDIILKFNSVSGKKTITFIPGDVVLFNNKYFDVLNELNGIKIFSPGNHDDKEKCELLLNYGKVVGIYEYKGFIISHIPLHRNYLDRYIANIHGHDHDKVVDYTEYQKDFIAKYYPQDPKYVNVNWDILNGFPASLNYVRSLTTI